MAILAGVADDSTYTVTAAQSNPDLVYWEDFVASASGNATSLSVKISGWLGSTSAKVILCNASGAHIAIATILSSAGTGWVSGAITSTAITSGTTYRVGVVSDGYLEVYRDSASWASDYDSSGSYASPPNPVTAVSDANAGNIAFRVHSSASPAPTITDVDTDETVTSTQTGVVHTGTGFGASQGASTLKYEHAASGVSISQTVTAWADTSITASIVRTSGGYSLPYGAITAEVETAGGTDDLAITLTPPDARSYVTLTSLATEGNRITAVGMAIGDQLEVTSVTGGSISDVTLNADGTFDNAIGVTSFTVRGWDATDGTLGTEGTQTVEDEIVVPDQGTNQGTMQAAARSAASTAETFNGDMIAWARSVVADDTGTYNELLIKALQQLLGSTETNINNLMALAAADRGVSKWQEIGSGLSSIGT